MKRAKKVEIPEEPIKYSDFTALAGHSINSAVWYTTNFMYSENEVARKLVDKGFPPLSEQIEYVDENGEIQFYDFVAEAIEHCRQLHLLDDGIVARSIVRKSEDSGKSHQETRSKLFSKGIDKDESDQAMSLYDENFAIKKASSKAIRSPKVRKAESDDERDRALRQKLMQKGFGYSSIDRLLGDED